MRVLVTGASGLIGTAVCDALLARGDEVVGLSRNPAAARSTNPTVKWLAWHPETERPPADALEGTDGVVNLLGEPLNQRWTDDAKRRIRASRIDATRNLIQGIQAASHGPTGDGRASPRSATTAIAARPSSTRPPAPARRSTRGSSSTGRPRRRRPRPTCGSRSPGPAWC